MDTGSGATDIGLAHVVFSLTGARAFRSSSRLWDGLAVAEGGWKKSVELAVVLLLHSLQCSSGSLGKEVGTLPCPCPTVEEMTNNNKSSKGSSKQEVVEERDKQQHNVKE